MYNLIIYIIRTAYKNFFRWSEKFTDKYFTQSRRQFEQTTSRDPKNNKKAVNQTIHKQYLFKIKKTVEFKDFSCTNFTHTFVYLKKKKKKKK